MAVRRGGACVCVVVPVFQAKRLADGSMGAAQREQCGGAPRRVQLPNQCSRVDSRLLRGISAWRYIRYMTIHTVLKSRLTFTTSKSCEQVHVHRSLVSFRLKRNDAVHVESMSTQNRRQKEKRKKKKKERTRLHMQDI